MYCESVFLSHPIHWYCRSSHVQFMANLEHRDLEVIKGYQADFNSVYLCRVSVGWMAEPCFIGGAGPVFIKKLK